MKTGFGWIEIGDHRYDHDIIIHTDGTVTKRKKKLSKPMKEEFGHTPLSHEELAVLKDEGPEIIYIGTGQYGDLPLTPEAEELLESFHSVLRPTPDILPEIEGERKKFLAIIHVTC
jgi:Uncharacterized conserved protein